MVEPLIPSPSAVEISDPSCNGLSTSIPSATPRQYSVSPGCPIDLRLLLAEFGTTVDHPLTSSELCQDLPDR